MKCSGCSTQFTQKHNLLRHLRQSCPLRYVQSTASDSIPTKKQKLVSDTPSTTGNCSKPRIHPKKQLLREGVELIQSAFKCRISTYRFSMPKQCYVNHTEFFNDIANNVSGVIKEKLTNLVSVKVHCELFSVYVKQQAESELVDVKSFITKNKIVTSADKWEDLYNEFTEELKGKAENFQVRDSGMIFKAVRNNLITT